jgi:hypothetical protein
LLTGCTSRLVDETGKGLGFLGTSASAWLRLKGRFGHAGWVVEQPDMHQQAEQYESDQQEVVKQRIGGQGAVSFS